MYIVCNKIDNSFINSDTKLRYWSNGYPFLINKKMGFVLDEVSVYEVQEIPSEVEPYKYCYTEEKGFYLNPNWVEPDPTNTYGIPDEVYHAIIDDYTAEIFGGEV